MAHKLADELLREILSPPLLVSDAMFEHTGDVSPFSKVEKSAADVLLVCKRWMRLATPSLLHTVVVRSMPQARALSSMIKRNPEFGTYIRRLRVEGSYGNYILDAVSAAPHITALCLTLTVWSDVKVDGLVKSLALIDPTRVILTLAPKKALKNKNHDALVAALCKQLKFWSRLKVFKFAATQINAGRHLSPDYAVYSSIVTALGSSPALEQIHLVAVYSRDVLALAARTLLESRPQASVFIYDRDGSSMSDHVYAGVRGGLSDLMQRRFHQISQKPPIASISASIPLSHSNPFYKPLDGVTSKVRHDIMLNIIRHALHRDTNENSTNTQQLNQWGTLPFDVSRFCPTVASVLLNTSQEFKALTHTVLAQHLVVSSLSETRRITDFFGTNLDLTATALTLQMWNENLPGDDLEPLLAMTRVTELLWRGSGAIFRSVVAGGSHLNIVKLRLFHRSIDRLNLDGFVSLRSLDIEIIAASRHLVGVENVPPAGARALPRLCQLIIRYCPKDILDDFAQYELPEWRELDYRHYNPFAVQALLERRGQNLQKARWQCVPEFAWMSSPGLLELEVEDEFFAIDDLDGCYGTLEHSQLETLRLCARVPSNGRMSHERSRKEAWKVLLEHRITAQKLPSLKTLQLLDAQGIWPSNERDARKSDWPTLAEHLHSQGIALLDGEGRAWRRRVR